MKVYKVKTSEIAKWYQEWNQKYMGLCTFQEYLEYTIGIPLLQYKDFMIAFSLPFIDPFEYNRTEGIKLANSVIKKGYEYLEVKSEEK